MCSVFRRTRKKGVNLTLEVQFPFRTPVKFKCPTFWKVVWVKRPTPHARKTGLELRGPLPHRSPCVVVSFAAVLCLVTQRSSRPQTAAFRTTFLSHCFCGPMKGPIMYQQIENDVSVRAKKDNGTSGRSFSC